MPDAFRLDGEVAIVTGASKGIGLAIAGELAGAGADVVLCGRNVERGEAAAVEVAERGGRSEFVRADVTDEGAVEALVSRCTERFGPPSVLVNNAGPTDLLHARDIDGPMGQVALDGWERVIRSTLTSMFLVTRQVLPTMVEAQHGSIINISSVAGLLAVPGFDAYAAGKGGMDAATRAVAAGYGHLGVRCNGIRVGSIAVDHSDMRVGPGQAAAGRGAGRVPLARLAVGPAAALGPPKRHRLRRPLPRLAGGGLRQRRDACRSTAG